jgi:hypothetical protein
VGHARAPRREEHPLVVRRRVLRVEHGANDVSVEMLAFDQVDAAAGRLEPSTYREHFDISLTKRALAVAAGAVEISWRQLGEKIRARRAQPAQEGRRC